jgi:hypothetical protein
LNDVKDLIRKAKENEERFDWFEAAISMEHAARSSLVEDASVGEIWERIGFCYARASDQAADVEEFRKNRELSVNSYKKAAAFFQKLGGLENDGASARCSALAEYVSSWLTSSPLEKRRLLDDCLAFGKRSLEAYEKAGDDLDYGGMCTDLLMCLLERLYVSFDSKEMADVVQEGLDYANKAITVLSRLNDKHKLLCAYFTAGLQGWYAANVNEQADESQELAKRSLALSEKALQLANEVNDPYCSAMSNWAAALCTLFFTEKAESSLEHANEMLKQGTLVRDNYLIGVAYYVLAFVTNWMMVREADVEKQKEGHKRIIKYAEDAVQHLGVVLQDFFISQTYLFYTESCSFLAHDVEVSCEERRSTLEKAVQIGRKGLEHAERSGSPDATGSTLHALSKALQFYSNFETEKSVKARLLEEALVHREGYNYIVQKAFPSNEWIRGVGENYAGLIKLDLARIQPDVEKKKALLESAVKDMADGVALCARGEMILSRPVPTRIAAVGRFEDGLGEVLCELHSLTQDQTILYRAIEVHGHAAEDFKKISMPNRVAESYWRMALNQNCLGERKKAAENFENALTYYRAAAELIPHFADFYLNYATYMKAWAEIERAHFAHEREEYSEAMKLYQKVAELLKESKFWSYLSPNFLAWSYLECGEDLSRNEKSIEAIQAFDKASQLFLEAKETFEKEVNKIQNRDEKEKALELSKASIRRNNYCLARVNVEQAKNHDRKGESVKSAEEYDAAASIFEKMLETLETEADRKELKPFAYICRAWQNMKMAEARASPELYDEASILFLRAKQHLTGDKSILLALGNSALCKALQHGTVFEETKEKEQFSKAKLHLHSAGSYYLKAGLDNPSIWATATEILLDAYDYMIKAETETDPSNKTKMYLLAEKCLERSAKFYESANYVGKRDEVLRIFNKVKEKREFALSLGKLLTAPKDASNTNAIPAPTMSVEEPVGLQKFEHAELQSHIIIGEKELKVGDSLDVEIELVNAGKSPAFLNRITEVSPKGFEITEKPDIFRVEDGSLNMKGRRLDPLKTEGIKLVLRPRAQGKFQLKPRILYLDEDGKDKANEPESIIITVKELGLRGWLKG